MAQRIQNFDYKIVEKVLPLQSLLKFLTLRFSFPYEIRYHFSGFSSLSLTNDPSSWRGSVIFLRVIIFAQYQFLYSGNLKGILVKDTKSIHAMHNIFE